jgi:hypothetical protein
VVVGNPRVVVGSWGQVNAAKASDKMILEGSNCSLGSAAAMDMGRDKLVVNFFLLHGMF